MSSYQNTAETVIDFEGELTLHKVSRNGESSEKHGDNADDSQSATSANLKNSEIWTGNNEDDDGEMEILEDPPDDSAEDWRHNSDDDDEQWSEEQSQGSQEEQIKTEEGTVMETNEDREQTYEDLSQDHDETSILLEEQGIVVNSAGEQQGTLTSADGQQYIVVQDGNGDEQVYAVVQGNYDESQGGVVEFQEGAEVLQLHNGEVDAPASASDEAEEGRDVEWLEEQLSEDGSQPQEDIEATLTAMDHDTANEETIQENASENANRHNSTDDLLRLLADESVKTSHLETNSNTNAVHIIQTSGADEISINEQNQMLIKKEEEDKSKISLQNVDLAKKIQVLSSQNLRVYSRKSTIDTRKNIPEPYAKTAVSRNSIPDGNANVTTPPKLKIKIQPKPLKESSRNFRGNAQITMKKVPVSPKIAVPVETINRNSNKRSGDHLENPEEKRIRASVAVQPKSSEAHDSRASTEKRLQQHVSGLTKEDWERDFGEDGPSSCYEDSDDLLDSLSSSSEESHVDYDLDLDIRGERAGEFLPLLGHDAGSLLITQRDRLLPKLESLTRERKNIRAALRKTSDEAKVLRDKLAALDRRLNAV